VILLNKTDLVLAEDLERLEARIRGMNAQASIQRTQNSVVDMDRILHVGGFNLDHAMEVDPKFLEPEYPYEWAASTGSTLALTNWFWGGAGPGHECRSLALSKR